MNSFEISEYLRMDEAHKRELDTWSKVSWGIAIGAFVMAVLLGQWSTTNGFGDIISLPGERMVVVLWLALLGAYFWRKRILEKRLHSLERSMSEEARTKLAMGDYKR